MQTTLLWVVVCFGLFYATHILKPVCLVIVGICCLCMNNTVRTHTRRLIHKLALTQLTRLSSRQALAKSTNTSTPVTNIATVLQAMLLTQYLNDVSPAQNRSGKIVIPQLNPNSNVSAIPTDDSIQKQDQLEQLVLRTSHL